MLKSEYIQKIRKDKDLRNKIALVCHISPATLYRWLRLNSDELTKADVLSVMSGHLGVSSDVMLVERKNIFVY